MTWEPILDGALADDARRAVRDIADAIAVLPPEQHSPVDFALFWAYVAGVFDDEVTAARFEASTDALFARIQAGFGTLSLYSGLTGAAWVLHAISENADESGVLSEVDQVVADAVAGRWEGDYELVQGLAGITVYLVDRAAGDAPVARAALDRVVHQLAAASETTPDGITWRTRPALMPPWQRERWPDGNYNCGLAHGVPGAVAALGRIASLPDPPPAARALCAGGMRWLVAQRRPPHPRARFPSVVAPGIPDDLARTAWCYGDPGVAVALWNAGARIGASIDDARSLALECAARPPELTGVRDAALCHGAAGLAHLFNRCFQADGDPVLREAARGWFARALAMRTGGAGIGGFQSWVTRAATPGSWEPVADFLDGAAGIALALIAGLQADEPVWDRLLLADIPPGYG